jgi:hypothetical protein
VRRLVFAAIIVLAACDSSQGASPPAVSVTPSPTPPSVLAGTIQTIAGDGTAGYSDDGGPATAAHLNSPKSVAVDAQGNVYIGEAFSRVRKVTPDGTITTVAGTGTSGFSGEGGPATAAMLTLPTGLAVDDAGTLYIADSYNFRVRKVTRDGIITTVAGTGYVGPVPGMGGYSGDGGPAILARIGRPSGVVVDGKGNLYVADPDNGRVRMVTGDGIIRTVAGPTVPGESQALDPAGVALDRAGNLFIADNAAGFLPGTRATARLLSRRPFGKPCQSQSTAAVTSTSPTPPKTRSG